MQLQTSIDLFRSFTKAQMFKKEKVLYGFRCQDQKKPKLPVTEKEGISRSSGGLQG